MRTQVRFLALHHGLRIWRCGELWCRWQTQLGPGVAVAVVEAGGYSANWTPSLGTPVCLWCGPKKTKDNKKVFAIFLRQMYRASRLFGLQLVPGGRSKPGAEAGAGAPL